MKAAVYSRQISRRYMSQITTVRWMIIVFTVLTLYSKDSLGLEQKELEGIYNIRVATSGPLYEAELLILSGGSYTYKEEHLAGYEIECEGSYNFDGKVFDGTLSCVKDGLINKIRQVIAFDDLTLKQLEDGVTISLYSSIFVFSKTKTVPFTIIKKGSL